METQTATRPSDIALDWRKDWRGKGQHGVTRTVFTFTWGDLTPHYTTPDQAHFDQRELEALREENRNQYAFTAHFVNSHRVTRDVFRHPEYRDAIVAHNPRSVFESR